jgi:hypothetical protein
MPVVRPDAYLFRVLVSSVGSIRAGRMANIQSKHSLDAHIHGRNVEGFKEDLSRLFTVMGRVQGSLGQEYGML